MTATLDRRTVLGLLVGSGLGLVVGGCSFSGGGSSFGCGDLEGTYEPTDGLVTIGTRYRELYPDDDPSAVGDLVPDTDDQGVDLARIFADQVRADFDAGETVDVDGWVLARTEARVAALLAAC